MATPATPIGSRFQFADLVGADLRGADLRGARLSHVNLAGASLRGARLDHAHFEHVDAAGACFAGVTGAFHADRCTFRRADFSAAELASAAWFGCSLEKAVLNGADLSRAVLAQCNAADASFGDCNLMWVNSRGTTYEGAELSRARNFFVTRELVVEAVRRTLGDDVHLLQILGRVVLDENWCYPEWKAFLQQSPMLWRVALDALVRYPASGCAEALQRGWRPPDNPRESDDSSSLSW